MKEPEIEWLLKQFPEDDIIAQYNIERILEEYAARRTTERNFRELDLTVCKYLDTPWWGRKRLAKRLHDLTQW